MNYSVMLKHKLQWLSHFTDLCKGKMTSSEYSQLTSIRYSDFIYSKNNVNIRLSRSNPTVT